MGVVGPLCSTCLHKTVKTCVVMVMVCMICLYKTVNTHNTLHPLL